MKARRHESRRHESHRHEFRAALGFLLPNFLGFAVFTAGPVLFSLAISISNWHLHRTVPFQWIALHNFAELLHDRDFWLYSVNTVYLMLGLPVAILGSLFLAILLSQRLIPPRPALVMYAVLMPCLLP